MGYNGRTFEELPPLTKFAMWEWAAMEKLPPHSYTILPRWKPNAAKKDVRVLSCLFIKNPHIAAPLLYDSIRDSYILFTDR